MGATDDSRLLTNEEYVHRADTEMHKLCTVLQKQLKAELHR